MAAAAGGCALAWARHDGTGAPPLYPPPLAVFACPTQREDFARQRGAAAAAAAADLDPALALGDVEAKVRREGEVAVVGVSADAAARAHPREEGLQAGRLPPIPRAGGEGQEEGHAAGAAREGRACSSRRMREVSGKHATLASSHTQRSMSASVFQSPP